MAARSCPKDETQASNMIWNMSAEFLLREWKTDEYEPLVYSPRCSISHTLPEPNSEVPRKEEQCSAHNIGTYLCRDYCDDENRPVEHLRGFFASLIDRSHLDKPWLESVHQSYRIRTNKSLWEE